MKDIKKGCIVINLRLFNKIVVPDNYLLSLQSEIINSIREKKYIIMINISNFFFQLFVYPDY